MRKTLLMDVVCDGALDGCPVGAVRQAKARTVRRRASHDAMGGGGEGSVLA